MANSETPITLEEQIVLMKKYVSFRQRIKMRKFLLYAGYFRASRYGKFLLSNVENIGSKSTQDALFSLYQFDVDLRRILNYYCNRVEVRFKSAMSNACAIHTNDGTFYLDKQYYTPSKGERDAKIRKHNIRYFQNVYYEDIVSREEKLRKDVVKYPELKEYRKGGSRQNNKLPVWVTFSYSEFGTMSMMYNYLRGDLRKNILVYSFAKEKYSRKDTELVDTWLDGVRNLRNYCAHNSMVVGMTSSVVLRDPADDVSALPNDNDLFSRLYALKKLLPKEDVVSLKSDLKKLLKKSKIDAYKLGIIPTLWEDMFDNINEF
ncbi:MAG: Abi family protein [Lachnospiraceae bacterium]|nr:Abi family protein [Lachnospiraceae bacterium]